MPPRYAFQPPMRRRRFDQLKSGLALRVPAAFRWLTVRCREMLRPQLLMVWFMGGPSQA